MRIDKFINDLTGQGRSDIKKYIKQGRVLCNGTVVKDPGMHVSESGDDITLDGKPLTYQKFFYYLLNKPAGVITATRDPKESTILDLFDDDTPGLKALSPVGRLDKDTTGLLLVTNDGDLAHVLLSPKHHVDKTYECKLIRPISDDALKRLEAGLDIGDDEITLPAVATRINEQTIQLTIREGRFHQVKRMLQAVGNEVIALKRLSMGPLYLEDSLGEGQFRLLDDMELQKLMILKSLGQKHSLKKSYFEEVQAVIFDLDGTIIDSMNIWKEIDRDFFKKYGLTFPEDYQKNIEGLSFAETAEYTSARFEFPLTKEEMMEEWTQMAFDQYEHHVKLKQGVLELLDYCKETGIKLGIATSNAGALAQAALKAHGIEGYFDFIAVSGAVKKGKPEPDIYLFVAEKLGVLPNHCLVFEDIIPGITAGKAAGMKTVAVYDSYSELQTTAKVVLADYYINDYHFGDENK